MRRNVALLGLSAVIMGALGCGGGGSIYKPIETSATLAVEGSSSVQMLVTRNSKPVDTSEQCSSASGGQTSWCSAPGFGELKFDVQPSFTLYRIYVRNSGGETVSAKVTVKNKNGNKSAIATLKAGETKWFWTLGVESFDVEEATEIG